jgi:cytochrome c556
MKIKAASTALILSLAALMGACSQAEETQPTPESATPEVQTDTTAPADATKGEKPADGATDATKGEKPADGATDATKGEKPATEPK